MRIWLVKKHYKEFDVWIMEIVDAFLSEESANACELNLTLALTPADHIDYTEYRVEPLDVKE